MTINRMRVEIDGRYRFAKLDYANKFTLIGFESRRQRDRYRRLMKHVVGVRATIGGESKIIPLTQVLLELANEGNKSALKWMRDEIARGFTDQTTGSAP